MIATIRSHRGHQITVQLHDNNDIEIHRDNKLVFCGAKETLEELAEATQAMLDEVKKRARQEKEARVRREVYLEANQIAIRLTQQTGPPKKIGRPRAI